MATDVRYYINREHLFVMSVFQMLKLASIADLIPLILMVVPTKQPKSAITMEIISTIILHDKIPRLCRFLIDISANGG